MKLPRPGEAIYVRVKRGPLSASITRVQVWTYRGHWIYFAHRALSRRLAVPPVSRMSPWAADQWRVNRFDERVTWWRDDGSADAVRAEELLLQTAGLLGANALNPGTDANVDHYFGVKLSSLAGKSHRESFRR